MKLTVARKLLGWLEMYEGGTYAKITQAEAGCFARPRDNGRLCENHPGRRCTIRAPRGLADFRTGSRLRYRRIRVVSGWAIVNDRKEIFAHEKSYSPDFAAVRMVSFA
jgi:hypothetical protein